MAVDDHVVEYKDDVAQDEHKDDAVQDTHAPPKAIALTVKLNEAKARAEEDSDATQQNAVHPLRRFLAIVAVLDVVVPAIISIVARGYHKGGFVPADNYAFTSSLEDVLAIALLRDTTVLGAVILSFRYSSRRICALLAAGLNLMSMTFLLVKVACYHWRSGVYPITVSAAVFVIIISLGVLELVLLSCLACAAPPGPSVSATFQRMHNMGPDERLKSWRATYEQLPDPLTARRLLVLLKPYFWPQAQHTSHWLNNRLCCLGTCVLVLCALACKVYSPLFLASAGNWLAARTTARVFLNAGAFCLLEFAAVLITAVQGLLYEIVRRDAYIVIARESFEHIMNLSVQWHLRKKLSWVTRAIDRGNDACDIIASNTLLSVFPALIESAGVCTIFLTAFQGWALAALLYCSLTLYAYTTIVFASWQRDMRIRTDIKDNELHENMTECMTNFETVKSHAVEDDELRRYEAAAGDYIHQFTHFEHSVKLLNILQQGIVSGCMAGSLALTAIGVEHGHMRVGDFLAVATYVTKAFAPLSVLGSLYIELTKAIVDLQALNQIYMERPEVTDAPDAQSLPPPRHIKSISVEFRDVVFTYPEQMQDKRLRGVSFKAPAGSSLAIVGATGSGKSTLSRLLLRYYDPLHGQVMLDGIDIRNVTQKSLRRLIGIVPQEVCLFNGTIADNIRYGKPDATMEEVVQAAKLAQLASTVDSLLRRYDTKVGERGLKLSGGEKQRMAIARCLLKDPPLILLDEATSALDVQTEKQIQDALTELRHNRTTITIAHRLSTVKRADQILVLDHGCIVERGKHDDLIEMGGLYANLWQMQEQRECKECKRN